MPGDSTIRWYVCYERKSKTFWNKQGMTSHWVEKVSTNFGPIYISNNNEESSLDPFLSEGLFYALASNSIFFFFVVDRFLSYDDEKEKIIQWFSKSWWFFFILSFFGFVRHHITQTLSERSSMFECRWLKLNVTYLIRNQYNR